MGKQETERKYGMITILVMGIIFGTVLCIGILRWADYLAEQDRKNKPGGTI